MQKLLYVAAGGASGSLMRYWVSGIVHHFIGSGFPWATLLINLSGSFMIGVLWGCFEHLASTHEIKLLLIVGLLGSFTTFSSFSLENFNLMRNGHYLLLVINIAFSVIGGVLLAFAGYFLARYAVRLF